MLDFFVVQAINYKIVIRNRQNERLTLTKIIQIASNPVVAMLRNADHDEKVLASTMLSYFVEGYEKTDAFIAGSWDGRSTFFDYLSGKFPAGFVPAVEEEFSKRGFTVQHIRNPLPGCLGPDIPVVDRFPPHDRYDYQMQTVRELEKRGIMIARVATGGGKSRIAKLAIARLKRNTIFVTTRKALMYQMKESFEETGWKVGVIGDSEWKPNNSLTVAMIQTLAARLQKPEDDDTTEWAEKQREIRQQTIEYLNDVEFIIGEEAHEASGNGYFEVSAHLKKAAYRLALTATPFMKDSQEANMRLMATFGPIGINISEKMLIERGILAKPFFKFLRTQKPISLRRTTPWQKAVQIGIVQNHHRNTQIVTEVAEAKRYGLTAIVLVQRKAHGQILDNMFKKVGIKSEYIQGESSNKKRKDALGRLKDHKIDVLIGTTILDVGVDVPAVGMVVLAGGGKAEVLNRQRIGRGLREKKNGLNYCMVVDFEDEHNRHLTSHSKTRRAIIEQTPGFAENILLPGENFPYDKLGYTVKTAA